ncbi:MAG: hypothetical protein P1U47_13015 [Zhongshania sp.]|uniref:hypothetical protein n=1 Tax=Zhongshania sp. TaxID=1971902 RepID=UPI00260BAA4D|nr:hypothetical protein [Zhongshania sp.]MDF1693294.1 hypothetical protein [Zhongshania sp.]
MDSYTLIQAVKTKLNLPSDNQAAAKIGITRATVSNHKTGRIKTLNDAQCLKVAEILELPPETVIADQNAEGAKSPEVKKFWEGFGKKLIIKMVPRDGIEPPTRGFSILCSKNTLKKVILAIFMNTPNDNFCRYAAQQS